MNGKEKQRGVSRKAEKRNRQSVLALNLCRAQRRQAAKMITSTAREPKKKKKKKLQNHNYGLEKNEVEFQAASRSGWRPKRGTKASGEARRWYHRGRGRDTVPGLHFRCRGTTGEAAREKKYCFLLLRCKRKKKALVFRAGFC